MKIIHFMAYKFLFYPLNYLKVWSVAAQFPYRNNVAKYPLRWIKK